MIELESEDLIHWVWYDNDNESLCGLDVTGHTWVPEVEAPVNCSECIEIDRICKDFYEEVDND